MDGKQEDERRAKLIALMAIFGQMGEEHRMPSELVEIDSIAWPRNFNEMRQFIEVRNLLAHACEYCGEPAFRATLYFQDPTVSICPQCYWLADELCAKIEGRTAADFMPGASPDVYESQHILEQTVRQIDAELRSRGSKRGAQPGPQSP